MAQDDDRFSKAAKKQFKKNVAKVRAKGIDSRTNKQKLQNFKQQEQKINQSGGDGRSQALQKAALQPTINKYKFLSDQENRRREMEEKFRTGRNVQKSDFTGYKNGLFGLRIGDFQDTGIPKLREGLSSADYAKYMRGLYDLNPKMMRQLFPVASGKLAEQIFTPAPLKLMGTMGSDVGGAISEGIETLLPEDLVAFPGRLMKDVKGMGTDLFGRREPEGVETLLPQEVVTQEDVIIDAPQQEILPNFYGGRSPLDELFASTELPSSQYGREYMKREGVQFPLRGYADGGVVCLLNDPDYDRMQNTNSYYGAF